MKPLLQSVLAVFVSGSWLPPGAPAATCDPFSIPLMSKIFPDDGPPGSLAGSIPVTVGAAGCAWLAGTEANWVIIDPPGGGTNSGTVTYSVKPNSSSADRYATIAIRAPGTISGYLFHTVHQLAAPIHPIQFFQFTPKSGPPGTQVRIEGSGFGRDSDALAVGVMTQGAGFIPMKVLSATDSELLVELGLFGAGAAPGKIIVRKGRGHTGLSNPARPGTTQRQPAWTWTTPPFYGEGISADDFQPVPATPPAGTRWFFSGPPTNGLLCLRLEGNWETNSQITIQLSAHDRRRQIGRDLRVAGMEFPGGGTLLDCATRLCQVLRGALAELGGAGMNCEVTQVGATAPAVQLCLSLPDGQIDEGSLSIAVAQGPNPSEPILTAFAPTTGGEGTEIVITGRNFGLNPRNLAAAMLMGDGRAIPLQVMSATDTEVRALVGAVPSNAVPGQLVVHPGEGFFSAGNPLSRATPLMFSWNQTGPGAASAQTFFPTPNIPIPKEKCYFSDPIANGVVTLTLNSPWPTPARVTIDAGLFDARSGRGRAIHLENLIFDGHVVKVEIGQVFYPLTVLECAINICDALGQGSLVDGAVAVNCSADSIDPSTAKVTLSMAHGTATDGWLNVCVEPDNHIDPVYWPVITDFLPTSGQAGDLITIFGRNFLGGPDTAPNPDNLNVSVLNGAHTIPLQVIQASDTVIQAVLGEVPPGAQPGHLRVRLGAGSRVFAPPALPGVSFNQASWHWAGNDASGESTTDFTPQPRAQPPGGTCYFSGPPVNGELVVAFPFTAANPNPWPNPAKVKIDFEATSECVPYKLDLLEVELIGAGSLFECAQRICEILSNGFIGGTNPPVPACFVEQGPSVVAIHVTGIQLVGFFPGPGGCSPDITSGHLNVCVQPQQIYLPPHIIDFFPKQAQAGEVMTLTGEGFGFNPRNLSLVLMNGSNSIPLQVLTAHGTELTARLGAVPANAQPGPLKLSVGIGKDGFYVPFYLFADTRLWAPAQGWHWTGESTLSTDRLTPLPPAPTAPPNTNDYVWRFSGPPTNGTLRVALPSESWPPYPQHPGVQLSLHVEVAGRNLAVDLRIDDLRWDSLDPFYNIGRLADAIQELSRQQAGVTIAAQNRQGSLEIFLSAGPITAGHLNVGLRPATPSPTITDVQPRTGREGDLITVTGTDLIPDPPNAPNALDYALTVNGAPTTPLKVISVTKTSLVARLGPVAPGTPPGPLVLALGKGQQGSLMSPSPDVFPGSNITRWVHSSITITGSVPFTPTASTSADGAQCFFSGRPTNGTLSVTLSNTWPTPALARIEARAENDTLHVGRKLHAEAVFLNGGGALRDRAQRVAGLLDEPFAVNLSENPDGTVQLGLSLPEGAIQWGHLAICVGPIPAPPLRPAPDITSVSPDRGGEGTHITIVGRNFLGGPDTIGDPDIKPEDLSVAIVEASMRAIPIDVIRATDTQIEGVLGAVPFDARPGVVQVSLGQGRRALFRPRAPGVHLLKGVWSWNWSGVSAVSSSPFFPEPNNPNLPNQNWSFSGPPVNGKLSVDIATAWSPGSYVRVEARAHHVASGIGGDVGPLIFQLPEGGSVLDCAPQICHTIKDAFLVAGVKVNCTVNLLPGPSNVQITLGLVEAAADWGALNISLGQPPGPIQPTPVNILPMPDPSGRLFVINGRGFGENPDDLLISLRNGNQTISFRALSCTDTQIVARIGLVPPDAQPGSLSIWRGLGRSTDLLGSLFPDPGTASWIWEGVAGAIVVPDLFAPGMFACEPTYIGGVAVSSHSTLANGGFENDLLLTDPELSKFLSVWLSYRHFQLTLDLEAHNDRLGIHRALHISGWDVQIPHVQNNPQEDFAIATRILQAICILIDQMTPGKENCSYQMLLPWQGHARMWLTLPEGPIEYGSLRFCIADVHPPWVQEPPYQTVLRSPGGSSSVLEFRWPRSATGYQLQVTDALGGDGFGGDPYGFEVNWVTIMPPMRVTDTEIQVPVPIDPSRKSQFFRLVRP